MLIEGLPAESALGRATGSRWTPTEILLVELLNVLLVANWQRMNTGKKRVPKPKPIRLSDIEAQAEAAQSAERTVELLIEQREREARRRGREEGVRGS